MKKIFLISIVCAVFFIGATNQNDTGLVNKRNLPRVYKKGPGFQKYVLGETIHNFSNLAKIRPSNYSHIAWDEVNCVFYNPTMDIKIGDFNISKKDVYLVFHKERLFRIRIINKFRSRNGRDLAFFNNVKNALSKKYGQVKSLEKIWNRYDGKYKWIKGIMRVDLIFSKIEFTDIGAEKIIRAPLKKGKKIKSSDI